MVSSLWTILAGASADNPNRLRALVQGTFDRWLKFLEGAEAARKAAQLLREQRLLRRRRGPSPLRKSKRSIAV
jgi:predicted Zn-dependent peptidase